MGILEHWEFLAGHIAIVGRVVTVHALHRSPAIVATQDDVVDFLVAVLANVCDPEFPIVAVKTEPPRIAETGREDFIPEAEPIFKKRVGVRNLITSRSTHIDPQHLAEQGGTILPVAPDPVLVTPASAITETDV